MHRPLRNRHAGFLLAAVAAVGLTVAGCGSDDDKAASTTTAPATTVAPTTAAAASASDQYCDAAMAINTAGTAAGDPDEDPVAFAKQLIGPAKSAAIAPAAIADQYSTAITAMQGAIDGDTSQFDALDQAGAQIDDFNEANCAWTKVPVTLSDFHYAGLPETLKAGDYTFQLDNTGAESHLLVIVKKKPGVTESFDELLASPDGDSKVDTVIAGFAGPGEQATTSGHLEAGEYLALCPIAVGSTGETEGTGPPHFTMGMRQALTVA